MKLRNFCLGLLIVVTCYTRNGVEGYDLTILHVNDIHVRFDETNKFSGNCRETDQEDGGCYGGVARLLAAVKDIQSKEENVIFLNGGDFYQGNVWYTHFKWRVVAHFANILNFTAMALGNHEFDDHVVGLVPLAKNASFPLIAANVDLSNEPNLQGLVTPSTVADVNGKKVGIIGYVTTDTPDISSPDKVKFLDEVEAIQKEANKLKASGVDILIALGHSGYERDQEIAANVEGIDLVVGGHSHSFLYSGEAPSVEKPSGPYPTLVKQPKSGRTVPVIQAYAYTKYLGYFKMKFDGDGEVLSWEGSPKLLNSAVKQDEFVLKELVPWRNEIEIFNTQVIGDTNVLLLAGRGEETNIGNFIADSMVHWYSEKTKTNDSWTSVSLGFLNSGGIRGSFEMGNITMADVFSVLPFSNTVDLLTFRGKDLKAIFETMGGRYKKRGFLQTSGFRMTIDLTRPMGDRVRDLKVLCSNCKVPKYVDLDENKIYNVTTVNYLADGGDGKGIISEKRLSYMKGPKDTEVFVAFAKKRSAITQAIEGRIQIRDSSFSSNGGTSFSLRLTYILIFPALFKLVF